MFSFPVYYAWSGQTQGNLLKQANRLEAPATVRCFQKKDRVTAR